MKKEEPSHDGLYLAVYLTLLALTVVTVACSYMGFEPILGVTVAIGVAAAQAAHIGAYFMHLREEKAVIYGVAVAGVLAVLVLAAGILPDIALRL
ncbi:MAG: cytochrome C oxidase subunit IV family protein [Elusimicrobia bacterium]|nr:cytochrome C oxidase subunit IV family protein [Elusimicrobiota bacterium]